jgi:hypothetical protein
MKYSSLLFILPVTIYFSANMANPNSNSHLFKQTLQHHRLRKRTTMANTSTLRIHGTHRRQPLRPRHHNSSKTLRQILLQHSPNSNKSRLEGDWIFWEILIKMPHFSATNMCQSRTRNPNNNKMIRNLLTLLHQYNKRSKFLEGFFFPENGDF